MTVSINEIVKAKGERIETLSKELNSELASLGYEVQIVAAAGSKPHKHATTAVTIRKKSGSKQKAYWRAIGKIIKQKGCTVPEARQIFRSKVG